jgi:hypothetical protein
MTFTGAIGTKPKECTLLMFRNCKNGAANKLFPRLCKKHMPPSKSAMAARG